MLIHTAFNTLIIHRIQSHVHIRTAAPAAKFTPSVQRNRVIPGMAPPGAAPVAVGSMNVPKKAATTAPAAPAAGKSGKYWI